MSAKILDRVAHDGPLQSLTPEELQLDRMPLTMDPRPQRHVRAWVRFGTPVKVDAIACRWTSQAVGIELEAGGRKHRCWVWAGAVEEIDHAHGSG
ncbi:hypothetical protein PU630_15460 [Microbacterium horticulturae]|uniref:Uncharacterized protein n=1 Tax=Microbacterium horticulturae TaxID=3028316 RepID=A0ABY8BXL4_9MICO|nr:hypothetical protein [Microbacterium sp. KACC 23027]WEG08622.1 hypothetical protein PU630_15460 [Microbacterium sp. KACC 23027]